jgi:hypothetical protein
MLVCLVYHATLSVLVHNATMPSTLFQLVHHSNRPGAPCYQVRHATPYLVHYCSWCNMLPGLVHHATWYIIQFYLVYHATRLGHHSTCCIMLLSSSRYPVRYISYPPALPGSLPVSCLLLLLLSLNVTFFSKIDFLSVLLDSSYIERALAHAATVVNRPGKFANPPPGGDST